MHLHRFSCLLALCLSWATVAGCARAPVRNDAQGEKITTSSAQSSVLIGADGCVPHSGKVEIPALTSISPDEAGGLGGATLTLSGIGFRRGIEVMIGQSPCFDVKVIDSNTLTCLASPNPGGLAEVLVRNPDGRCGRLPRAFTYVSNVEIQPKVKTVAIGNQIQFATSNGKPPFNYTLLSGSGSIDAASGLYQAPDQPSTAVIRVTDAMSTTSDAVVTINPPLKIVPSDKPGPSGFNFDVTGGAPPVTYSVAEGDHFEGDTSKSSTGMVVRVQDSAGNKAEIALAINRIVPLVLYPLLTNVVPGDRINFLASGGVAPYSFKVEGAGDIHPERGVFQAPSEPGTTYVRVTDAAGSTMQAQINVMAQAKGESRLTAGYAHTCVQSTEGVKCVGDNRQGQLGDGTLINRDRLAPVIGLDRNVLSISAGYKHTCAVQAGGTAKCWGDNSAGQLGDASDINTPTPQTVFGLNSGVQTISAGQFHSCAVVRNGAFCWGSNRRGQLGNGSVRTSYGPVPVRGLNDGVVSVVAGAGHSCALTKDGAVKCWGFNGAGQLGDGTVQDKLTPIDVLGMNSGVNAIYAGGHHTCALKDSRLYCWGNNNLGQIALEDKAFSLVPVEITGIGTPSKVSLGFYHSCAASAENSVYCWGFNDRGQLGVDDGMRVRPKPVQVATSAEVLGISAGSSHTCIVIPEGLSCWGSNDSGQFSNKSVTSSIIPIPAVPFQ